MFQRNPEGWLVWFWYFTQESCVHIDLATWHVGLAVSVRKPRWASIALGPIVIDFAERLVID